MESAKERVKNVVLVHGAWVDGSGWEGVYRLLTARGFSVTVVQNPTVSLTGDVEFTRRALDAQDGAAVLVGHSYGGAVITQAGVHAKVAALVYVAGFVPARGESVASLVAKPVPGAPPPPILPPRDGFILLDKERFPEAFAGGVSPEKAAFMADSQTPWGLDAANEMVTEPAWESRPSWYLVAVDDQMIPPAAQRSMASRARAAVTEVPGSHSIYISNPGAVTSVIEKAVEGVKVRPQAVVPEAPRGSAR